MAPLTDSPPSAIRRPPVGQCPAVHSVGGSVEIGDQDSGTNWPTTEVFHLQFTPLGPGAPLFVTATAHVTYNDGDFVVDFTNVADDEECIGAG